MSNTVTYQVNLKVVGDDVIGSITKNIEKMTESTRRATKTFGDCYKALFSISQVAEGLSVLEQGFNNLLEPGANIIYDHEVPGTLTSSGTSVYWNEKRGLNATELRRMSTFPSDFDFCGVDVRYICGMSLPPFMIQRIVEQIKKQWFLNSI